MPSLAEQAQTIADLYQPPQTGRPSDIASQSTVQQFLEAVGEGNYIETAAKLAGITKQSVYEWIRRGHSNEPGTDAFKLFADAVEKAEARAEAKMLANVRRASELPQFWAAGMTVLERRHPDRWGKRQDDNNQPKVVVNIGVGAGEVRVGISGFAPALPDGVGSSPLEAKGEALPNLLETQAFANLSSPITALMLQPTVGAQSALVSAGDRRILAVGSTGGTLPPHGEAPQSASGVVKQRASSGRVSARGGRIKKRRRRLASLPTLGAGDV